MTFYSFYSAARQDTAEELRWAVNPADSESVTTEADFLPRNERWGVDRTVIGALYGCLVVADPAIPDGRVKLFSRDGRVVKWFQLTDGR